MAVTERATRRWTVEEYHRAAELGLFGPEERLELIEGEIYPMSPQLGPHATGSSLAEEALRAVFRNGWVVRVQKPLTLAGQSEPEPDIAVVRGSVRDFASAHPQAAELVVEVADTTLAYDRGPKAALYARAGIPEYWVLNLRDRQLEVFRQPNPARGEYLDVTSHDEGATVSPLAAPAASIAVRDLLP